MPVCRVWAAQGTPLGGALFFDATGWTAGTSISLEMDSPTLARVAAGTYRAGTPQGTALSATAARTGRYTFKIESFGTSLSDPKPAYWLRATHTDPRF